MSIRRFIPTVALLLSGCAGAHESYPSLARRPIETAPIAEVTTPAPVVVAVDPKLAAEIAQLKVQAEKGRAAFDTAYARAEKLTGAAAGAAVSSDAWVAAQQAISNLEAARNDSISALASLDTLYVERTKAVADGKAQGGTEAIDAVRTVVLANVDGQNDRVDGLKGRLKQP
jgi:multidrug resistance efflux pump